MPTEAIQESAELDFARQCYRAGDFAETIRVCESLSLGPERVTALLLKAATQGALSLHRESLKTLAEVAPLIDSSLPFLRSCFYGQRGKNLKQLKNLDSALIDYEAARYWARESKDEIREAGVRNNLAHCYSLAGRFEEAIKEVNAAIRTVTDADDVASQGIFLDQKARILCEHRHYEESILASKRAIEILTQAGNETTLTEARLTLGQTLVTLGAKYMETPDAIETFKAKRALVKSLSVGLTPEIVSQAMAKAGGRVPVAAESLGVSRMAIIKVIEEEGIERQPKRRRGKSLLKK